MKIRNKLRHKTQQIAKKEVSKDKLKPVLFKPKKVFIVKELLIAILLAKVI